MFTRGFFIIIMLSGCQILTEKASPPKKTDGFKIEFSKSKIQNHTGWWIYGEGQHIFKDEATLGEWDLEFPNEDMSKLKELYLAVCEMEYFPMECRITGYFKPHDLNIQNIFIVTDFEILYVQGCE